MEVYIMVAEPGDTTVEFSVEKERKNKANAVIMQVYNSMMEKGYEPISQFVGYIISGDPTYITSYNNARYLIQTMERDELLEEFVGRYLEENKKDHGE
jgi:uncharacterized protein (UPF0297 family)